MSVGGGAGVGGSGGGAGGGGNTLQHESLLSVLRRVLGRAYRLHRSGARSVREQLTRLSSDVFGVLERCSAHRCVVEAQDNESVWSAMEKLLVLNSKGWSRENGGCALWCDVPFFI